jgi:ABC-type transport system substrate-binding protein
MLGREVQIWYTPTFPGYAETALAVSADLARVGINAPPNPVEPGRYATLGRERPRALGPWRVGGFQSQVIADVELSDQLSMLPPGDGTYNNPEFDRLYQEQLREFDREKRRAMLQQIMKILHEDPPAIFLFGFTSPWAAKQKVDGFQISSDGFMGWDRVRILQ